MFTPSPIFCQKVLGSSFGPGVTDCWALFCACPEGVVFAGSTLSPADMNSVMIPTCQTTVTAKIINAIKNIGWGKRWRQPDLLVLMLVRSLLMKLENIKNKP